MIARETLFNMYIEKSMPVSLIARALKCSEHKVNYWLARHGIQKRSISESMYLFWNPNGDPFRIKQPKTLEEAQLYGLGIGLYWGEGTKKDRNSIRLGNSDPKLVKKFLKFLLKIYAVDERKLRFGLQIFGDMDKNKALQYWMRSLNVSRRQFFPTITVTPHRGVGNYRHKTKYGVVTVHFCNRKLRDIICNAIEKESMC